MAQKKLSETELNDYFTWVKAVWVTSRGEPLDFKEHRYLEKIYVDQHPHLVYQKPSQCGVSERLISEATWVCDRLGKTVLYTFPTSTQLADFVQARLEPVFQFSEYLARITGMLSAEEEKERDLETKKKVKKVGLKKIRNAFLYLRGSQNQQQIISVDADMAVLDERDRFTQEHVPYIDKRLAHSTLKWRREASTPTLPGRGINLSFQESDQRVWMLKCSYCSLEQELDFFKNVDLEKAITVCEKCRKPINRLKGGRWVAQAPQNKEVHGYKINGVCNPRNSVQNLIDTYRKAQVSGFSAMQQFYNQTLGLPYEAEGQAILVSELDDCVADFEVPFKTSLCFGGADVGEKIHVIISKKFEDRLRYVWIGTVSEFLGPRDSLEWLMDKYDIRVLVVDAKPDTRKARELIARFPNRVYAAYYPTRKFDVQNYYVYDDMRMEVSIDRTISIDYLVSDLHNRKIEIPSNGQYLPGFYDHMTASVRKTEINKRTGQAEARWEEKGADHYFHACLHYHTRILMGSGKWKMIGDVVGDKDSGPVYCIDENNKLTLRHITRWFKNPLDNRRLFWLSTKRALSDSGKMKRTLLTEDHPVLTTDSWKNAREIKTGDKIFTGEICPNSAHRQVIIGGLLGDAYLSTRNKRRGRASLQMCHSIKQKEYLLLKVQSLSPFFYQHRDGISRCKSGTYPIIRCSGKSLGAFGEMLEIWYPNGKKIIPNSILREIDVMALAVWFMDDGSVRKKYAQVWLTTNGFERGDVLKLQSMLFSRFSLNTVLQKHQTSGYSLRMNKESSSRFLRMIAEYIPPSMRYKLPDRIEKENPFNLNLWNLGEPDIFIDEAIIKETNRPEKTVYNIDVEEYHNYITTSAIVHNCNYNRVAMLKGGVGKALLDSYKNVNNSNRQSNFYPRNLAGWLRWANVGGQRVG